MNAAETGKRGDVAADLPLSISSTASYSPTLLEGDERMKRKRHEMYARLVIALANNMYGIWLQLKWDRRQGPSQRQVFPRDFDAP